jgi:crotonobetaine/carnitine-CoA ligase
MILFTTGSTAAPKAVLWTHANLLWAGKVGALQQGLRPDDIYQVHLPLFHVVGFTWSLVPALWAGATILLQPVFSKPFLASGAGASGERRVARGDRWIPASTSGARAFIPPMAVWLDDTQRNDYFRVNGTTGWGMTEMVIPAYCRRSFDATA